MISPIIPLNIEAAQYVPIRVKTMWPALMFAANRNERVRGRTLILIVSIITKKGFNQWGAPPGKRPAIQLYGLNMMPDMIRVSHIGRPNLKVNSRCLE